MSAFHYAKDSGNFARNSNGRSVSVFSDRNFRDHFRGGPHISVRIFRPKFTVPFLINQFFPLIREFRKKKFKMSRAISIGWPGLREKMSCLILYQSASRLQGTF